VPRARRTAFAAPFVVCVGAAACSHDKPGTTSPEANRPAWTVYRQDGACHAERHIECPPPEVATCNPPAPITMPCPPEAPATGTFQIVGLDGDRCVIKDTGTAVTCPGYGPPPPPPAPVDAALAAFVGRHWEITRSPDGRCWAADDPCTRMKLAPGEPMPPCNPPAPIKIDCPAAGVVAIVEQARGECMTETRADCDPGVKCNPPAPAPIACPP